MAKLKKKATYIYRIVTIQRALDIFENKVLGLVKPASWKDPFENYISKVKFLDLKGNKKHIEYLDNVFGLCFSLGRESSLMWDAYTPNKNGIRLKIDLSKLVKVLQTQTELDFKRFTYRKVEYARYKDFLAELKNDNELKYLYKNQDSNLIEYFFKKRREYGDEREYRIIYDANGTNHSEERILNIKINPNELIEGIRFDPKMPDNDCETLTKYFSNKGFDKRRIVKSLLYKYQINKTVRLIKIKR
jgi:hypothetical protein